MTSPEDRTAQFRYGVVFLLMLVLVVFEIAAPATDLARAMSLLLTGAAVVVAVATARERRQVRERNALVVAIVVLALVGAVAAGAVSLTFDAAAGAVLTAAVPVILIRGVVRMLRERGVTLEAVAGALAIYLSVGLVFALVIGFITHVDATPYFAQGTDGTEGERVYFSFTVLTTTGFGDFSAATPAGHALAVIEMLTGQIYLVTVIGLLIGRFSAGRATG